MAWKNGATILPAARGLGLEPYASYAEQPFARSSVEGQGLEAALLPFQLDSVHDTAGMMGGLW